MSTDHLAPLHDGWSVWKLMVLRGAGFPAREVLTLADADAAAMVDVLLDAQAPVAAARARALDALDRVLETTPREQRKAYTSACRRIRAGVPPGHLEVTDDVREVLAQLAGVEAELVEARAAVTRALETTATRASTRLREVAQDARFRAALRWQNPGFVNTGIAALLRRPPGANDSNARQYEMTLASYVQRYCVKNDTIGFFGPVGFGTLGDATRLVPGPSMLSERIVFFEHWGIDALATTLSEDPVLKPRLVPRRMPTVWVEGTTLHHPIARTSQLPEAYARLLAACDGERPACTIAEELVADPALELASVDEVYELLEELVEKKLVTWTLEIATDSAQPDRTLRELLETAGEAGLRGLVALDELEARRQAVVAAHGTDAELARAFGELEATFTSLTAAEATRKAGQVYAGRTLVYEDCRRDVEFVLGPEHLQRLGPALAPVLQSARWYTYTIGERYRATLVQAYRDLCAELGTTTIDYFQFWERVGPHFGGDMRAAASIVGEVADELNQRWMQILGGPFTERRVTRSAAEVQAAAAAAFEAPRPGWASARHHSPDIIIAATSADAMAAGDLHYVLGEIHVATNTVAHQIFMNMYGDQAQVVGWTARDLPRPRVAPVIPRANVNRTNDVPRRAFDFDLETGSARSSLPRTNVLPVGELVVQEVDGKVSVCARDHHFDLIDFFDHYLQVESITHFNLLPALAHTPRITIDKLVVSRERWTFAPTDLPFAHLKDAAERYIEMRRWARAHALPRLVFYKVPEEPKPCFLDLDSPSFVDLFLKLVRKATKVHISEMLPVIDDCWLTDAEGHRYTSELRIVAVDTSWDEPTR